MKSNDFLIRVNSRSYAPLPFCVARPENFFRAGDGFGARSSHLREGGVKAHSRRRRKGRHDQRESHDVDLSAADNLTDGRKEIQSTLACLDAYPAP